MFEAGILAVKRQSLSIEPRHHDSSESEGSS